MPTPEALARQIIDQKLTAAGWIVQDFKSLNLGVGMSVAVREFQTASGPAFEDEIVESLQYALAQFENIAEELGEE